MNAQEIIKMYGQEQLLRFESELTDGEKKKLYSQIESLDFDL